MKNEVKRLFIYTVISFVLLIMFWLVIVLFATPDSKFGTALAVVSIIPCVCYIFCGTKLLAKLGWDHFYPRL